MTNKNKNDQPFPRHYMVTFGEGHANAIQTYLNTETFVPMRWNDKTDLPRKIVYQVKKQNYSSFKNQIKELTEKQGRDIKIQRVKDVFCNSCGALYEYRLDNRTGEMTCAECGNNNFVN